MNRRHKRYFNQLGFYRTGTNIIRWLIYNNIRKVELQGPVHTIYEPAFPLIITIRHPYTWLPSMEWHDRHFDCAWNPEDRIQGYNEFYRYWFSSDKAKFVIKHEDIVADANVQLIALAKFYGLTKAREFRQQQYKMNPDSSVSDKLFKPRGEAINENGKYMLDALIDWDCIKDYYAD